MRRMTRLSTPTHCGIQLPWSPSPGNWLVGGVEVICYSTSCVAVLYTILARFIRAVHLLALVVVRFTYLHWYSCGPFIWIGVRAVHFLTLVFVRFTYLHWYSCGSLICIGIRAVHLFACWYSCGSHICIGIRAVRLIIDRAVHLVWPAVSHLIAPPAFLKFEQQSLSQGCVDSCELTFAKISYNRSTDLWQRL